MPPRCLKKLLRFQVVSYFSLKFIYLQLYLLKFPQNTIILVELQRRRGDMVENGQKLENGVNVLIKSLIFEIPPIGMII